MRLIIKREVTAGVVRIIHEYVRAEVLKCIKAKLGWVCRKNKNSKKPGI